MQSTVPVTPLNPYATVVKQDVKRQRTSKAAKNNSTTSRLATQDLDRTQTRSAASSTTDAIKTAIMSCVRKADIPEILIMVIDALLEPLLQALLPQLSGILHNLCSSVHASNR